MLLVLRYANADTALQWGTADHTALVEEVKAKQRTDPMFKAAWVRALRVEGDT